MTTTKTAKKVTKKVAKKAPAKKAVTKQVIPPVVITETTKDPDLYYVTVKVNGDTYKSAAYDVENAVIDACPRVIKTNMTIFVEKDGKVAENFLLLLKAKLLLRNALGVYVFCNRLIFK